MSAINTTIDRGAAVRRRATSGGPATGRTQADRGRPIGSTGIADADQRGGGVFGFPQGPQSGGILQRLGLRPGADQPTAPAPATVPLTGVPVADPGQVEATAARLGIEPGTAMFDTLSRFSTAQLAAVDEAALISDKSNEITRESMDILGAAAPGQTPFARATEQRLLEEPEAISEAVQQAAISKATDSILGSRRTDQQRLQESLAARGISDSGLGFALSQAGSESASRDIAGVERDVLLQAGLAQSQREVQQQQLMLQRLGISEPLAVRVGEGQAGLNQLTEVPAASLGEAALDEGLDSVLKATDEADAERRISDLVATLGSSGLAVLAGQLARGGKFGLAALAGLAGAGLAGRNQG